MALEKPIARRYARAIIELARKDNALDAVAADMDGLAALVEGHAELRHALMSPSFKIEQRAALLKALMEQGPSGKPAHKLSMTLVSLLADKGRIPYIPLVAQMFREEADRIAGRVRAEVWSAKPLDKAELEQVAKALEGQARKRQLGTTVVVNAQVDENLLAGVKAQLGGLVFDGTLRSHLKKIGQQLSQNAR